MKVVCMGDSITAGQYCPVAWPDFLGGDHEVVNRGVSNDTTRNMLERFPADVQQSGADVVVIQAGHNDCNRWDSDRGLPRVRLEAYRENLYEMIARCHAFEMEVVLCTITPSVGRDEYERRADVYNLQLRDVGFVTGVLVAETRKAFQHHPTLRDLLLPDGIHLSEHGHEVYAGQVRNVLNRMLVAA